MGLKMNRMSLRTLLLVSAGLACSTAHAGLLDPGWAATKTQGFSLKSTTASTALAATAPMKISLSLPLRNVAPLQSLITAVNTPGSPQYGRFLTPAQFLSQFGPTAAQAQAVSDYLKSAGFTNVSVAGNRQLISASGTAAMVQNAFHTTLKQFKVKGVSYFANTQSASMPLNLAGSVVAVLGLNNLDLVRTAQLPVDANIIGGPYTPQQFQKAYGADSMAPASNTKIAIFAFGDMTGVVSDLRQYETQYALSQVPVSVVKVGAGPWSDDGGRGEWSMDVETSTAMAGSVQQLIIYNGSSLSVDDMAAAFNQFVVDNAAKAGSLSAGGCEVLQLATGASATEDQIFMQAVAQGQTIFASTGDTGATCPIPVAGGYLNGVPDAGIPGVEYPASSPWVVAVGGTTLSLNADGSYDKEIAWDAGGGGVSLFEPAQSWQTPFLPLSSVTSALGLRALPDIAMDAEFLLSGAALVVSGADSSNGGTSLASPLALGAWARIQTAHANRLGFASPALYSLAKAGAPFSTVTGFRDITFGTNGLFLATQGWDFTTGLGSINTQAVSNLLH